MLARDVGEIMSKSFAFLGGGSLVDSLFVVVLLICIRLCVSVGTKIQLENSKYLERFCHLCFP